MEYINVYIGVFGFICVYVAAFMHMLKLQDKQWATRRERENEVVKDIHCITVEVYVNGKPYNKILKEENARLWMRKWALRDNSIKHEDIKWIIEEKK